MSKPWTLDPDRLFDPDPDRRSMARSLYTEVEDLPIVGPHGDVPPALLADQDATLGSPAELFIVPGHYVFRMLYSQGIPMPDLGVPTVDGTPVETDHRRVWQRFCEKLPPVPRYPDWTLALRRAHRRLRSHRERTRRRSTTISRKDWTAPSTHRGPSSRPSA
jgi:glucuronate isomerase